MNKLGFFEIISLQGGVTMTMSVMVSAPPHHHPIIHAIHLAG